jgi:hypothetical protein
VTDQSSEPGAEPAVRRRTLLAAGLVGLSGCLEAFQELDPPMPPEPRPPDQPDRPPAEPAPGARIARPDEVQQTIDAAAEASGSPRVALLPDTEYRPRRTWTVRSGVTLDHNGARVTPAADVDVHEIQPRGQVLRPVVDLRAVPGGYSASVFRFDSERHGFYGDGRHWYVRGGITRGQTGDETVFEFRQGGTDAIYFVHADHTAREVGTVVEMHRGDAFGINGVRIYGVWYGFRRGIHMYNRQRPSRSVDNMSGNHFDVIAQPTDAEILWDMEVGRFNVVRGRLWDFNNYSDVMWRIHDGDVDRRIGNMLYWFPVGGTEENLFQSSFGESVFDDRLGDRRNRVVVPWLQGTPPSEF